MPDFFSIIKRIGLRESLSMVSLTGGGAFKFEEPMRVELGVEPVKKDELECLVKGSVCFGFLLLICTIFLSI